MAEPSVHGRIHSVFQKALPACARTVSTSEKHKMIHKQYHTQGHQVSDGLPEGIPSDSPVISLQEPDGVLQETQAKDQGTHQVDATGHTCDKR